MTLTPFRLILGLNAIVVFGGLILAYGGGAVSTGDGKVTTLLMPFAVSLIDLALGVACLVLMLVQRLAGKNASTADQYMQAFMISFGLVLVFAVPACMYGIAR